MTTILGILILVCALFLVVSVLLQSSKNHRMSGVVSGGAETFFGKQKGKTIDAKLSKATAVIAAIFALLILSLYLVNAHNRAPVSGGNVSNDNVVVDDAAGADADETEGTEAEGTENTETEGTETEGEGTTEAEGTEAEGEGEAETEGEAAAE